MPLRLIGPFHSPLMRDVVEQMKDIVAGVHVDDYPDLQALGAALRVGPADAVEILDGCSRIAVSVRSRQPEVPVTRHFQRLEAAGRTVGTDDRSRLRAIAKGLSAVDDLLTDKGLDEPERMRLLAAATGGRVWRA